MLSHFNAHRNACDDTSNSHLNAFWRCHSRHNLSAQLLSGLHADVLVVAVCRFPGKVRWHWSCVEDSKACIQKNLVVASHKNYQVSTQEGFIGKCWIMCNFPRQCSCWSRRWTTWVAHRQQPRELKVSASGDRMVNLKVNLVISKRWKWKDLKLKSPLSSFSFTFSQMKRVIPHRKWHSVVSQCSQY